jgi:hypothetical protein
MNIITLVDGTQLRTNFAVRFTMESEGRFNGILIAIISIQHIPGKFLCIEATKIKTIDVADETVLALYNAGEPSTVAICTPKPEPAPKAPRGTGLSAAKRQLTKDIANQREFVADILDQLTNQHPQPNGDIYLHGERITKHTYNVEKANLDIMIAKRLRLDRDKYTK